MSIESLFLQLITYADIINLLTFPPANQDILDDKTDTEEDDGSNIKNDDEILTVTVPHSEYILGIADLTGIQYKHFGRYT